MNDPMHELTTDGNNYDLVQDACVSVLNIPGMICEVGCNHGGGMALLIKEFVRLGQPDRVFVGVDPYGDLPYQSSDRGVAKSTGYHNQTKNSFLSKIYALCHALEVNLTFINMTDTQFFARFADGIPVYVNTEAVHSTYALVVIDGPHTTSVVGEEFAFFKTRMSPGGIIIFDDIGDYDHMGFEPQILAAGFERVLALASYKRAYRKL